MAVSEIDLEPVDFTVAATELAGSRFFSTV